MTDDLYERYKEALRLGHVAVLRGTLEEALTAYRSAAEIAPSRALPHTSLGGALLRLGRLDEALIEYAAAVARAPHDEGALLGQAEALTSAGQRAEAARVLDHVSEIEEAAGRLPEAADTLRRALELEDSPERARRQRGLRRETRLSAGDQAAEQLLARALRLRDEPGARTPEVPRSKAAGAPVARPTFPTIVPVAGPPAANTPESASAAQPAVKTPTLELQPTDVDNWRVPPLEVAPTTGAADAVVSAVAGTPDAGSQDGPRAAEFALYSADDASPSVDSGAVAALDSTAAGPDPKSEAVASAIDAEVSEGGPAGPIEELDAAATAPADRQVAARPEVAEPSPEAEATPVASASGEPDPATAQPSEAGLPGPGELAAAVGVMAGAFDTAALPGRVGESEHQPTGDELLVAAEAADAAGDEKALRSLLVWTARAYAREGLFEAGLDAAHRLLQRAPGDVDAHLVLVELYVARNWNGLAAEKLALLGRLADLDDDEETRQRLCAVASRVFPKDERLEAICS